MNNRKGLGSCLPLVFIALLTSCATTEVRKSELDIEMEQLYKSRPTEMIWMDQVWENEQWSRGYGGTQYNTSLTEFVRPPESVNDWTELLTLEVIWKTSKVYEEPFNSFTTVPDPIDDMERLKTTIQTRCANPLTFKKTDEDRSGPYPSVRFYIACDKFLNGSPAEAQVHQVSQGRLALYHIFRIRRAVNLDAATIDNWAQGMKGLYVCDNKVPGQECGKKKIDKVVNPDT